MTNAHCQDCGDPIFRYDGQEFCPTCEKPVDRETGAGDGAEEGEETQSDGTDDGEQIEVAAPSEDARVQFGGDADSEGTGPETPQPGPPREQAGRSDVSRETTPSAPDSTAGEDTELARSRAELHRRIQDLSRRAGACEDPREAEAHLAAAREAAEALAALRR